jgi:hypothetical protein
VCAPIQASEVSHSRRYATPYHEDDLQYACRPVTLTIRLGSG